MASRTPRLEEGGGDEGRHHGGQDDGSDQHRVLGLIVVASDKQVVVRLRQRLDQPQLGGVYVLELVDQDVRKAALPAVAQGRI